MGEGELLCSYYHNVLTLPSQFVVFERKNQCLLEKGIQAKIHV